MLETKAGIRPDCGHHEPALTAAWGKLETAIGKFRLGIALAEAAGMDSSEISAGLSSEVQRSFDLLVHEMHVQIGNEALPHPLREALGRRVQNELLPLLLSGDIVERSYSKPRGYAGDYEVIERLYANEPRGTGRVGSLVDQCFLNTVPAHIVRGRRKLFADEIAACAMAKGDVTRVCVVASGPAGEVFDAFRLLQNPEMLNVTLIDSDAEALEFVAARSRAGGLEKQIRLMHENPVFVAMGRTKTGLSEQDLVYSLGLVDYLSDRLAVKLLNVFHRMLRPGGRGIVGNYHPVNPARELMEYLLDWKLRHRTEPDMNRLFQESAFASPCTRVRYEAQGVNLFAECQK